LGNTEFLQEKTEVIEQRSEEKTASTQERVGLRSLLFQTDRRAELSQEKTEAIKQSPRGQAYGRHGKHGIGVTTTATRGESRGS
jgi:hypothetical protein